MTDRGNYKQGAPLGKHTNRLQLREARLAHALRENLKRRKAQARGKERENSAKNDAETIGGHDRDANAASVIADKGPKP
jgi:hypothetical protein